MQENRIHRFAMMVFAAGLALAAVMVGCSKRDDLQYQSEEVVRDAVTNMVTATGTLNPVRNITVGCQVSGRISMLYADFNSEVKSNQVIAEIDPRTYEAQVAQARADLANARANLELQQAEAKRSGELRTNSLISESDYETAIAMRDEAAATVQIKEASLSNAMANLGYCKIYSPVDGTVISRNVEVGQTVAASLSAPILFQIANDLTKMQIDSSVAEADVGGVEEGQPVEFSVDAYPYRTFHGTVTQVRNAPTTANNVVTYDCVIGVTNADLKLKPGMTANVSIIVAAHRDVLKIPNAALRFNPPEGALIETNAVVESKETAGEPGRGGRGGGGRRHGGGRGGQHPDMQTVYLLQRAANGTEKLKPVEIKTGITDNIYTEVLSGLKEGDSIVTGLEIPGMSSSTTRNPFAFHRF
ncbi:MAG TPA: efflux RND transporter periplasmic adaptor subunit [Verrucomicrobiae bacterium]|nr:efflux RND transporter periplasmic adaptor subunit [Verrucomicrobiae bacterium]